MTLITTDQKRLDALSEVKALLRVDVVALLNGLTDAERRSIVTLMWRRKRGAYRGRGWSLRYYRRQQHYPPGRGINRCGRGAPHVRVAFVTYVGSFRAV